MTDDPTEVLSHPSPPPMPASAGKTAFDALSVRDLAAMHALSGVLAAHAGTETSLPGEKEAAEMAVAYADELLRRLADTPFPG
jgi:hypothetical protein